MLVSDSVFVKVIQNSVDGEPLVRVDGHAEEAGVGVDQFAHISRNGHICIYVYMYVSRLVMSLKTTLS